MSKEEEQLSRMGILNQTTHALTGGQIESFDDLLLCAHPREIIQVVYGAMQKYANQEVKFRNNQTKIDESNNNK